MKDLRIFETENEYINEKDSFEYPQLSLTEDNGKVWVKESENYFTAILNITEDNINDYIGISYKGVSELHNSIQSIYINDKLIIDSDFIINNSDGLSLKLYKFNEVGFYTIKYILPKDITSTKLLRGLIGVCFNENFNFIVNEETVTIKSSLEELDVINLDTSNVIDMETMFAFEGYDVNLKIIKGIEKLSTSNVTNMRGMFFCCNNLTSLDLSNFDTSNVTTMDSMFGHCKNLTSLDLSSFDTSKVTDMTSMFRYCSNLTSIEFGNKADVSKVTSYNYMFDNVQECTLTLCNNTQESWSTLLSKVSPKPTNISYIECNE